MENHFNSSLSQSAVQKCFEDLQREFDDNETKKELIKKVE